MFPDIGPIILFGIACFLVLVGLVLGLIAFFITNDRRAIFIGVGLGVCAYILMRNTVMKD